MPVPARRLTGRACPKSNRAMGRLALAGFTLLVVAASSPGAVRTVHVVERADVLDGRSFARSGPYEKIIARAWFTLDPKLPANRMIRDLNLAVANANGLVEFSADVHILKPRDPSKGNGTILLEVPNRGGKAILNRFCFARASNDPTREEDFGDKWLLDEGYTLVWVGWQWDVPSRPGLMRLEPAPLRNDIPTAGLVRSEFIPDHPTKKMPLGDRGHSPIPVGKPIRLLVRDSAASVPVEIPAPKWKLSDDSAQVEMPEGFQPGLLYEFVYEGGSPVVTGLGLAAVRDIVSYLKHGGGDNVSLLNEQSRYLKRSVGFGISQSGRFLRTFLYEGFNADEQGRRVFDGVWADVGGAGRGSFNFRYAQASRDGNPWSNVFYPTDVFPFAGFPEKDPATGRVEGLLDRAAQANVVPKLFLTSSSYEYWGRAAALTHTRPDGLADAPLPPEARSYFFAGAQHFPRSLPLSKAGARHDSNPTDQRPFQRALLHALEFWVKDNVQPPPSVIPRLIKGELTSLDGLNFPHIPGITPPRHPRLARRLDFGPEFLSKGYSTQEPPKVRGSFPLLVPQVDRDGNDLGGVKLPEVAVPLGTFTGWNLRAPGSGAPSQMASFVGSFIAFPRTKAERLRTHDSRLSIEERYADRADYMQRVASVVDALVAQHFVLERDRTYVLERCGLLWDALIH
jgi:hypothetical protein